jgi:hypothetical protein
MDRGAFFGQNILSPGNSNRERFSRENGASVEFDLSLKARGKSLTP